MRLSRQTVVITGAGGGIGRALAAAFAAEGAAVALGDLGDAAKPVAELIERSGRGAVAVRADIASSGDMARLADAALARFGRLDALVTCAGVDGSARMAEQDEAAWTRVIDVNLNGTYRAIRAALPAMMQRRTGRIVTMASILGRFGG